MTSQWNEAVPPRLPPIEGAARLRLVLRGAAVAAVTLVLFAGVLAARAIDIAARGLGRRPALGPRVVQIWGHVALPLAGLRYSARGAPMDLPGALVANHASWLDIVVLTRAARVFFVSKAEVAGWPVIGAIARAIGTVFIERRAVEARRQQEVLRARLLRGDRMCIFPEGTSTDGRRVLRFKTALFGVFFEPDLHETLWVQPVSMIYRAPEGLPKAAYGWWGKMDFGAHLAAILAHSTGGSVEVVFHPPLKASDFADRKALADRAGALVREGFEARAGTDGSAGIGGGRGRPAPGRA